MITGPIRIINGLVYTACYIGRTKPKVVKGQGREGRRGGEGTHLRRDRRSAAAPRAPAPGRLTWPRISRSPIERSSPG